jgi:hypothetical protein
MKKLTGRLRAFQIHGVVFTGETETQMRGDCPFTDSPKFYVHKEKLLWDVKNEPQYKGNFWQFLAMIAKRNEEDMTSHELSRLARDRNLPTAAFEPWGVGFDGIRYTIPVRNHKGTVVDIRCYRPSRHGVITTAGCKPHLLGHDRLRNAKVNVPVFICEGEWDAMALDWNFKRLKKLAIVVAVPGASVFNDEWADSFANKDVYLCYDNDEAGAEGEMRAHKALATSARSLHALRFPDECPEGYDVRDWVLDWSKQGKPRAGLRRFMELFIAAPETLPDEDDYEDVTEGITFPDVESVFRKWLFLDDTDGIRVALATVLSNRIDGDPIWMFLVAPPGGAKTETLNAFRKCRDAYVTSSLTAHSLISGMQFRNGIDPSLIPKLDGKVLMIKDFTAITALRDNEKDEIFGILRDAYDGRCGKTFGNGVVRNYESRFSLLAAVTPIIYSESSKHSSLGERFLKFAMADNLEHFSEEDIITQAISNVNDETAMREEMQSVVKSFLAGVFDSKPRIPPAALRTIVYLAKFGARVRATVARDRFRPNMVEGKPSAEVGSRLGKQLAKMVMSLALVDGRDVINDDDIRIIKKIIVDTVPQRAEDVIRYLWRMCPDEDDSRRTKEIAFGTRYPIATVSRLLDNYNLLNVVQRVGPPNRFQWQLTPYVRQCIVDSGVYDDPALVKRDRLRYKRKERK